MTLTLNRTTIMQCALWAFLLLMVAQDNGAIPPDLKQPVGTIVAVGSLWLHFAAGKRNSNGTPQEMPFIPAGLESAAQAAYEAYRATAGKNAVKGTALPSWTEISSEMQTAWQASVGAAQAHEAETHA